MAISDSGVEIQGSDFATRIGVDPKNKGNTAALKLMLIADPGFAFNIKLNYTSADIVTHDDNPAAVVMTWWIGYQSSSDYRYNTTITLQLPNGRADLENELVFVVPFIDPAFGEQAGPGSDYAVQVGATVYNRDNQALMSVDIFGNVGHENVNSNNAFQFMVQNGSNIGAPASAGPFGGTSSDVVYNQVFFRSRGVGLHITMPARTCNSVEFSIWPNNNSAYACTVTMSVLNQAFSTSGDSFMLWLPFVTLPGSLTGATLVTTPYPYPNDLTNLNCVLNQKDIQVTPYEVIVSA
ncbi:MAG: hypothetical protein OHK0039_34790 [Bacteroidia bacterium]